MAVHLHTCPHVQDGVKIAKHWKRVAQLPDLSSKCGESKCQNAAENWICLSCGVVRCGRWAKKHFVAHHAQSGHRLAVGTGDLSFWCYGCDGYLDVTKMPILNRLYSLFHRKAFGAPPPGEAQSISVLEGIIQPSEPAEEKKQIARATTLDRQDKQDKSKGKEGADAGSLPGAAPHRQHCPHLREKDPALATFTPDTLVKLDTPCQKSGCCNANANWICLTCRRVLCGRWAKQHMLSHFQETGHAHAFGTGDLSVWCYGCDSYLNLGSFPGLHRVYSLYHEHHFGAPPPGAPESITGLVDQGMLEATASAPTTGSAQKPSGVEQLSLGSWQQLHGSRGDSTWNPPRLAARADVVNRPDQKSRILAHEYLDEEDVLRAKMKRVAALLRQAKCTVVYTGAGLSRSSGIADYASRAEKSVVEARTISSPYDAEPTFAHRVIVAMERAGLVQQYVQQNHDGLPQKAGFPQRAMNEIHGAWYDVSNPVVPFDGNLRFDLFTRLLESERKADLCLCLGTSMSGMNSDRVAASVGHRASQNSGGALGTVVINLQQVGMDRRQGHIAVRVWAQLDRAFKLLAEELKLDLAPAVATLKIPITHSSPDGADVFVALPYEASTGKTRKDARMRLDLRRGQKVKVVDPYAANKGAIGTITGKDQFGNYLCELRQWHGGLRAARFGWWFVQAAFAGELDQLPIVNAGEAVADCSVGSKEAEDPAVAEGRTAG
eukprot:gb/GEZN01003001.1/.p1 GENE.gb/GEZN01003001.1/~~gb/GEZN01003001.1/.p1  ORF type:complete len:719 (-),score=97.03 gb/GEZN01003001.1/:147-2303(-)